MRTTSPTTVIAGGVRPASRTCSTMSPSVPVTVRCSGVVPQRITATSVSGARPLAISFSTTSGSVFVPIKNTSVSTAVAGFTQSRLDSGFSGSSWPVITANVEASPRCVTGMPAYAGTATAEVTPGTTTNTMPASRSAVASSPPRPKTKGSPPLSRTTCFPSRAFSISSRLIASWSWDSPAIFPTKISSASERASLSNSSFTSRSYTMTSASFSRCSPATVIRPGSPGPAPTRWTFPGSLKPSPRVV